MMFIGGGWLDGSPNPANPGISNCYLSPPHGTWEHVGSLTDRSFSDYHEDYSNDPGYSGFGLVTGYPSVDHLGGTIPVVQSLRSGMFDSSYHPAAEFVHVGSQTVHIFGLSSIGYFDVCFILLS